MSVYLLYSRRYIADTMSIKHEICRRGSFNNVIHYLYQDLWITGLLRDENVFHVGTFVFKKEPIYGYAQKHEIGKIITKVIGFVSCYFL